MLHDARACGQSRASASPHVASTAGAFAGGLGWGAGDYGAKPGCAKIGVCEVVNTGRVPAIGSLRRNAAECLLSGDSSQVHGRRGAPPNSALGAPAQILACSG